MEVVSYCKIAVLFWTSLLQKKEKWSNLTKPGHDFTGMRDTKLLDYVSVQNIYVY